MISSMTGYGRGEVKKDNKEISVELRTLNNRFLDISVRLPKNLINIEDDLRNIIKRHLARGRVNLTINIKESNNDKSVLGKANIELARHYHNQLKTIKNQLNLSGKIRVDHLLPFSDIFLLEEENGSFAELWEDLKTALEQALVNLKQMRLNEGKELSNDLVKRIEILEKSIVDIEGLAAERVAHEQVRLREKIDSLIANDSINEEVLESRLEMEIAVIASRLDVTEECTRFKSHNKMFLEIIESDEAVGRKLNFLLQEMTREANTIGSKAYDADISHIVVTIKEEVEKIREQVQNIE